MGGRKINTDLRRQKLVIKQSIFKTGDGSNEKQGIWKRKRGKTEEE